MTVKRAHYFQHVPFEGLGSIQNWLDEKAYAVTHTRFYDNVDLPKLDEIDFLIVMGGPMSVNDEQDFPWLRDEKVFVRQAIDSGKPVLGICLGAQIIAASLGATILPNPEKEIGWFNIRAQTNDKNYFQLPSQHKIFHWHGETFDLPKGAVRLASSEACLNQAFQINHNVLGFQFHLETTPESAQAIVENCRGELVNGNFIQSEDQIFLAGPADYVGINSLMSKALDYLQRA